MRHYHRQKGLTLIESLVAVGVLSFFILIFGASYMYVTTNTFVRQRTLAYNLATEEIEALRNTPFAQLTDRTDAAFMEVQYNKGSWLVDTHSSEPSPPHVLAHTPLDTSEDAQIIIPGYEHTNLTLESEMYVSSASPSGWENGLFIRYRDSQNYYHVYFSTDTLYISKNVAGTPTVLNQTSKSFATDTWHPMKVTITGSTIDVYVNDVLELSGTDAGAAIASGRLGLSSSNGSYLALDDITITDTPTLNWDFDSEIVGGLPAGWIRLGVHDLALGTTKLTIADDQVGYSDIKQVTARVEWLFRDQTRAVEIATLITQ